MKTNYLLIGVIILLTSCDSLGGSSNGKLTGTQSDVGTIGSTFAMSATGVTGVSNCQASVTTLSDGISTISGSATITNNTIIQSLNAYQGETFALNGNTLTLKNLKVKFTSDGIEKISGQNTGVIVNYNSSVGDTYSIPTKNTVRTVTAKSTTDSYAWGGMLIKTMEVSEPVNKCGVKRFTYVANHKWSIVALIIEFDDNSTLKIPIVCSKSN